MSLSFAFPFVVCGCGTRAYAGIVQRCELNSLEAILNLLLDSPDIILPTTYSLWQVMVRANIVLKASPISFLTNKFL